MKELIEMYLFAERRLTPRLENALVTWMMMLVHLIENLNHVED